MTTCLVTVVEVMSLASVTTHQNDHITGFNKNYVKMQLCIPFRSSSCPGVQSGACTGNGQPGDNPWILYGALIAGPDRWDNYVDDRNDYIQCEVACDYNAGFQSSVAALLN